MASKDASKPNIVFILSDDQGAWALGCYGNREIITPNLDGLAARGIRFDEFFCTSPVCSPARASLLTGRIPSQHGVHDWIRAGNTGDEAIEYLAGLPTYTDVLAAHGYECALSGKWHLGASDKPQQGFAGWYVHQAGGGPYYDAPMIRRGELVREPGYVTDAITDEALRFLDENGNDDRPFYLSLHYTAPHSPWIANHPQEIVDLYADCAFETCRQEPRHPWSIVSDAPNSPAAEALANPREALKGYFAAVTAMDRNIGRVLARLDTLGLTENTLVVFTSDNGFNCGHHGIWGKGNGTFPLNMYDTSIKVPLLMSHPGRLPMNRVSGKLLSGYDIMPTLLDYVGLPCPAADRLPGRSFVSHMLEEDDGQAASSSPQDDVVVFDEYGPTRMIRTKQWKYVRRYPFGPDELYHLRTDPGERVNRIDQTDTGEVQEALAARLDEWFLTYVDPAIDGTKERVSGNGQIGLAGAGSKGKRAYFEQGMTFTVDV